MGCLVNGQRFTPSTSEIRLNSMNVSRFSNGTLLLHFRKQDNKENRTILFFIRNLRQPGIYKLDQIALHLAAASPSYGYYSTSTPEPDREYMTNSAVTGQLIVSRFDSVARIIAGTFEFTARQLRDTATVRITAGRLDVHYPQ